MTLSDLYDLAEKKNIEVESYKFNKIDALSIQDDRRNCYIAIDPFRLKSTADEKQKLAHELGHCITGSFYNKTNIFDLKDKHEYKANKWMYKHLLPFDKLKRAVKQGYDEPYKLAEYFNLPQCTVEGALKYYKESENKKFD